MPPGEWHLCSSSSTRFVRHLLLIVLYLGSVDPPFCSETEQELQKKLQEAENLKRKWRCVDPSDTKTWQDNRCGPCR
eukprot:SAG22_NODE_338_length_12038_cov_24.655583_3_plen_77_part_00